MGQLLLAVVFVSFIGLIAIRLLSRVLKQNKKPPELAILDFEPVPDTATQRSPNVIAGFILKALTEQPHLLGLRYRYLELCYENSERDEFLKHAELYKQNIRDNTDHDWEGIQEMGLNLFPDSKFFTEALPEQTDVELEPEPPRQRRFGDEERARPQLEALAEDYAKLRDSSLLNELDLELLRLCDRPTQLQHAKQLSAELKGAQIYFKREDLTGASSRLVLHLMGQGYIAKRLGRKRLLFAASTAQQAILATQAAIRNQMRSTVYLAGNKGMASAAQQAQLDLLHADILETEVDEYDTRQIMLDAWLQHPKDNFMALTLAAGPHPYPGIASDIQNAIGRECYRQIANKPHQLACIIARGDGQADGIGLVEPFLKDEDVSLKLVNARNSHAEKPREYPSLKREHAWLADTGRVEVVESDAARAQNVMKQLARSEGIIIPSQLAPTLQSAIEEATARPAGEALIVMLS